MALLVSGALLCSMWVAVFSCTESRTGRRGAGGSRERDLGRAVLVCLDYSVPLLKELCVCYFYIKY